jgi:NAD(P)H-dependent FMN reductase
MLQVGVILGSTRPGRNGGQVAAWVMEVASRRRDAHFELVDVADLALPLLDEPLPPALGRYAQEHTRSWAAKVASFDAFVFITPEYNRSTSAALKNAIDFVHREWNDDKAAGFVGYGGQGGTRAVEHLRLVMGELQVADVRAQVSLFMDRDFRDYRRFEPSPGQERALTVMLDQVVAWGGALQGLRKAGGSEAAA